MRLFCAPDAPRSRTRAACPPLEPITTFTTTANGLRVEHEIWNVPPDRVPVRERAGLNRTVFETDSPGYSLVAYWPNDETQRQRDRKRDEDLGMPTTLLDLVHGKPKHPRPYDPDAPDVHAMSDDERARFMLEESAKYFKRRDEAKRKQSL